MFTEVICEYLLQCNIYINSYTNIQEEYLTIVLLKYLQ